MTNTSKSMKRLLREHTNRAREAEMNAALQTLAEKFDRWEEGGMSCHELHDAIHEYHDGIGRDIWRLFASRKPEIPLAHAVAGGFIGKESLPTEVLEHIESMIEYFEQDTEKG